MCLCDMCLHIGVLVGLYVIHTRRPPQIFFDQKLETILLELKVDIYGVCRKDTPIYNSLLFYICNVYL